MASSINSRTVAIGKTCLKTCPLLDGLLALQAVARSWGGRETDERVAWTGAGTG